LPELTAVKLPAGGLAWPELFEPQQASVPLVRTPQLWEPPPLTALKLPAGGVASPERLFPQQAGVPSVRTPQLCEPPALTLPATASTGAVAIETPSPPVGGAAARAEAPSTMISATMSATSGARRERMGSLIGYALLLADRLEP
jgi:hypothetical protein